MKDNVLLPLLLTLTAGLCAPAQRAAACTMACDPSVVVFDEGAEVPANLVLFEVLAKDPGPLSLHTKSGEAIAASIKTVGSDRVFSPDEVVPAGTEAVLEYTVGACGGSSGVPATYSFTVIDAAEVKLRPAELVVERQGLLHPGVPRNEAMFFELRLYDADELGTVSHLIRREATVDGVPVWISAQNGIALVEVTTGCSPETKEPEIDTCGGLHRVPPGKHTVEVKTRIIGQDEIAPATIVVETSCEVDCGAVPTRTATDTSEQATEATDQSNTKQALENGDDALANRSSSSCSARSGAPGARYGWLGFAGLAALLQRRRQRAC